MIAMMSRPLSPIPLFTLAIKHPLLGSPGCAAREGGFSER
jgi:hypothetical protein